MLGMLEAMLSFLRRQIGLRTDAADAAGSLHAKVADAKSSINSKIGTSSDTRASNTVMGWLNTPIKSIQRGLTTVSSYPTNVTISSVNTSKAFVAANGRNGNNTTGVFGGGITARLTSSTNLELNSGFYFESSQSPAIVSWEVIEFY